jgi:hypothetical protein
MWQSMASCFRVRRSKGSLRLLVSFFFTAGRNGCTSAVTNSAGEDYAVVQDFFKKTRREKLLQGSSKRETFAGQ